MNTTRALSIAASLSALSTAMAVHAQPRVIYCDASNIGAHSGATWSTAFRDLQDAIYAAKNDPGRPSRGVEIRISQGVYTPDRGTGDRSLAFVLNSAVTLMGGFAGLAGADPDQRDPGRFVSVLSGDLHGDDGPAPQSMADNSRTILDVSQADITAVDGFTIRGVNNTADPGIPQRASIVGSQVLLRSCTIEGNRTNQSPLISGWPVMLWRCRVRGNTTVAAPLVSGYQVSAYWTEFRGNVADGGIIGGYVNQETLLACLFADNLLSSPTLLLPATLRADSCTFVAHPIYPEPALWAGASSVIRNCIFASGGPNSASNVIHLFATSASVVDMGGSNLVANGAAGLSGVSAFGVLSGDPLFVNPTGPDHDPLTYQDNDYHLRPGSPAIDRALLFDSLYDSTYMDLDGRPPHDDPSTPNLGAGVFTYADIGAYEFDGQLCPVDFDRSGSITVADIFAFLNAWLAGQPSADFNGGGLSVQDIFDFVNAWLQGC